MTAPPQLDSVEARILGCLLEKQKTTPDSYPLTLNALRLACNQSTNRDPVVDYDEELIFDTIQKLHRRGLTRSASSHGSRSAKYRHLVGEELAVDDAGEAILAVLLLRGAQTPGELKTRADRMHRFDDLETIDRALESLVDAGYVERLERRPGEKQVRFRHLLGDADDAAEDAPGAAPAPDDQLARLWAAVTRLEGEVAELRERIG
jgi:uncharacterized protein YceH (UPF0502 family)